MARLRSFAGRFPALDDETRRHALARAWAARPAGSQETWVFAYGGLMWDPEVPYAEVRPARLAGWHRAMCVWSALARGSPARPGLTLGLLPGGSCDGLAFRLAGADDEGALARIFEREMWTDVYRACWLTLESAGGGLPALVFIANRDSAQFADGLGRDEVIGHIATAAGERGTCRDYLAETVAALRHHGIEDDELNSLQAAVAAR